MECVYFWGVRNILAIDINMPAPIQKHFPFAILDIEHRASQMLASAIQKKRHIYSLHQQILICLAYNSSTSFIDLPLVFQLEHCHTSQHTSVYIRKKIKRHPSEVRTL